MRIIIGLGNPGKKYDGTRHNIGFAFLDFIQKEFNLPEFETSKKFNALITQGKLDAKQIILLKPQTFMNLSGETVISTLNFFHLSEKDILVIHDDMDLKLGKYKIATNSSSAGHNGVKNIIERIGTQKFQRIRIGIRPEEEIQDAADFVLRKFKKEELKKIEILEKDILTEIEKMTK